MRNRMPLFLSSLLIASAGTAAAYPIAGLHPDRRPTGAPVVHTVQKDAAWYRRALTGISRPYPESLRFLRDQGNWYTPFNRPGMHGRYDLRGWYRQ